MSMTGVRFGWSNLKKSTRFATRLALSLGGGGRRGREPLRRALHIEALEARTLLSFAAPHVFDVGALPRAVAVADFMGAGRPEADVVTANDNGTLSVLRSNGNGTLQGPVNYPIGGTPVALAVGDLLHNGLSDVVTANNNGTVSVFLSNNDGTLESPRFFPDGTAFPKALTLGDIRGDGQIDIVTANGDDSVSVLLNNGDGTFQSPLVTHIGGEISSVALAVGHFTSSGKADLAVGNMGRDPWEGDRGN
jgi:hypothetical protein